MRRLQCLFTSDKPTSHNIHKCIFTILQHRSMLQYSTPLFQSYNTDRLQKTTTFIPTMGGKKPQMVQKIVIIWPYYIYILYTYIHIHAHIARCTELTLSFHNFRPLKKKGGGGEIGGCGTTAFSHQNSKVQQVCVHAKFVRLKRRIILAWAVWTKTDTAALHDCWPRNWETQRGQ